MSSNCPSRVVTRASKVSNVGMLVSRLRIAVDKSLKSCEMVLAGASSLFSIVVSFASRVLSWVETLLMEPCAAAAWVEMVLARPLSIPIDVCCVRH